MATRYSLPPGRGTKKEGFARCYIYTAPGTMGQERDWYPRERSGAFGRPFFFFSFAGPLTACCSRITVSSSVRGGVPWISKWGEKKKKQKNIICIQSLKVT